jgi:transposase-like protein
MSNALPLPETLVECIRYFSDADRALAFVVSMRWPDGVKCPRCGSERVRFIGTRKVWECRECRIGKRFSAKTGTIMEDSPLPLGTWMAAIWLLVNAKNGISSYEISRALGITQKSAWFVGHRVRLALQAKSLDRELCGQVEADETFIGGRARNMHAGKRKAKGRGAVGKAVVMGVLEWHGEVRTFVVPNTRRKTLQPEVRKHVEPGAEVYTDALASYTGLSAEYVHQVIDHAECYAKGAVHTNGMENFWSLLKRAIHGTYVAIEPFHLFRYLDEQSFRFNRRKGTDQERFIGAIGGTEGRRLRYNSLIGADDTEARSAGDRDAGRDGVSERDGDGARHGNTEP